jgi:hypothetical protein
MSHIKCINITKERRRSGGIPVASHNKSTVINLSEYKIISKPFSEDLQEILISIHDKMKIISSNVESISIKATDKRRSKKTI